MSKQYKQYLESIEQEQKEKEIMQLLDDAYEIEKKEKEMIDRYNRQINNSIAVREYSNYIAVEFGEIAA